MRLSQTVRTAGGLHAWAPMWRHRNSTKELVWTGFWQLRRARYRSSSEDKIVNHPDYLAHQAQQEAPGESALRRSFRVRLWHPLLNLTRPIRHRLGLQQNSVKDDKSNAYRDWADRQFAAPSPQFVKLEVLLRNGLRDATWVETGTFMGDTTDILSKVAKVVYSIEPEPILFSRAEQRFRNTRNVKIINGLSEEIFPKLLPRISGNICFWLEGHYSEGFTFRGPGDTPILKELPSIGSNVKQMDKIVVMVDDVRCFDPRNPEFSAYPPVDVLVDWARKHNFAWHIEHDIFIAKN